MNTGWIKLYRSILDWEWWSDRNTRDLFVYCLIRANHESVNWRGHAIAPGQFVTTIRSLAIECGLTVRETRTALSHLISTHELTQETTHDYSILTVCNYDKYQGVISDSDTPNDTPADTQETHDRHTTDTHNKNDKNIEGREVNYIPPYNPPTEDSVKPKRSRKQFVAPSVNEVAAYCKERNNNIDPDAFINFYESKGWMIGKSPMKDWKAAVRTWEAKRKADGNGSVCGVANGSSPKLGPGEFIRQDGSRTYGTGIITIPNDAPPRPNERCTWSSTYQSWIM
jgi:hypothetical protein